MDGSCIMTNAEFALWRKFSKVMGKSQAVVLRAKQLSGEIWGLRALGKVRIEVEKGLLVVILQEVFEECKL